MPDNTGNTILIPNDVFFRQVSDSLAAGNNVTLTVKGYSMYPFMRNGKDRVCLAKYDGSELSEGDVILFRFHGKYVLHRIYARKKDASGNVLYRTVGDGNVRGEEYASPESISGVMVRRITPSGKEWECGSLSWRFLSFAWMRLRFVRRWCLAVLRRIYR